MADREPTTTICGRQSPRGSISSMSTLNSGLHGDMAWRKALPNINRKKKLSRFSFWIALFVLNNLGPVQTPSPAGGGGWKSEVSACPQYGNRIRDWVPLFQRSYLEMGASYGQQGRSNAITGTLF